MKTQEMTSTKLERPATKNENRPSVNPVATKQNNSSQSGKYQRPNYLLRLL
ncbi:hypothetical protein [Pedobacter sp. MC2016-24]|uniref:hypothetical protein n=1 Tax=Pedobacter sp. MC2016-24 TaxID=2780090 RepID=UPI00187F3058|nr:hypothetical protein [Pedobacter sp. MC2016-24]MBE9597821.1 hypothetical protein [Pedobacter sp. MC2016-24]